MKKIFLLICFVSSGFVSFSTGYIDSLENVLKNNPEEDSNSVNTNIILARAKIYVNPFDAMKNADEGLRISEKINWGRGIILSCRQKGNVFYVLSDFANAMKYFTRALKLSETLEMDELKSSLYTNIGNVYVEMEQYDKAMEFYQRDLLTARQTKNIYEEALVLLNIGTLNVEENNLNDAEEHFKKSLVISEENNYQNLVVAILNNMAIIFNKRKNYVKAIEYLERGILLADKTENLNMKATALNSLGKAYYNLNNFTKSESYSNHSLQLARNIGSIEWMANAYLNLSEVSEKQNKFEKALDNYKNYVKLQDSIMNDEKKSEITKKGMQYEYEKAEALKKAEYDKQIAVSKIELQKQHEINGLTSAAGGILILSSGIGFLFYKRRRDAVEQKKASDFRALVSETEMKALRSQMNPHFIFNSLNSINDYMLKNEMKEADKYLTKFSKVMRLILENSEKKEISIADDIKVLDLYLQLEVLRLKNKFTYEIIIDESIDQENTLVPPMILQPFVENSIWHGLSQKQGQGKLLIQIKRDSEMINCIVEDNGIGRRKSSNLNSEQNEPERQSLGMKITKARIDIINKIKKTNAGVELSDLSEGLRVEVRLPLELSF